MTDPAPVSGTRRRAALAFIFVTVLIDVLAFGVIIPVLPHLVEQFVGGKTDTAAYWIGAFGTAFALIQFVTSPVQGALSDRYGRRPVILLSCLGLGLDFVFMALAPSLAWLFVGRIISAITSASFTTANAYVADITPPEQRAKHYGLLGAAFGLGFIVGPLIGGWLGELDLRLPFWFAAVLALLNFVYGLLVLPESLPAERRAARFDWSQTVPFGSLKLLRRYPQIFGLAVVVFIANLAHYVYPSVFVLFADYAYRWGQKEVGYVLAVVGVLNVIVNVVLVGRVVRGLGERRALLFSLACGALGFAIYGAADVGWMFLLGLPVGALWAISAPATQALITRQVGPEAQGRIQGALMSLVSVAGIVGPGLFAGSFGYFIGERAPLHLPGAPWYIAGLLLALAALIAWRYAPRSQPAGEAAGP
ncbi:TCR/Tet family MFS transporter [Vulcaniibacterium tengchongense]|uniref:DHA1 family tetracycline resistance protein-like MFS transporter n=1 Tax=Vulcaniibacterium tengchongense TaxID=1273429 RepID=A0A3N4VSY9_9GAMM|nr:TCR/Tet family MFS transporter [Vulcaniibacterium tengchongense]RPE80187.1 DHA1 family tetracycline resistance protein-like MFS transporter [Vulcaniibacterium tengchongense]